MKCGTDFLFSLKKSRGIAFSLKKEPYALKKLVDVINPVLHGGETTVSLLTPPDQAVLTAFFAVPLLSD